MVLRWQCWRMQKALGPYRDGELSPQRRTRVERHIEGCLTCRAELAQVQRVSALLRAPIAEPPRGTWEAFWPQVRERLSAAEGRKPVPRPVPWPDAWRVRWWPPVLTHPRLAMGSAALALALLAVGTWQGLQWMDSPVPLVPQGVVVQSVESADPNSTVMVFSHPETELTVVWVFGLDQS